jgi:pentose-5-phosphate-3-epimerase
MAVICPTVTAFNSEEYGLQVERLKPFASRVHIDLMDGEFAPTTSPPLEDIWWPHEWKVDLHLMYQRPMDHLAQIIRLKPELVIVHNEAHVHHMHFSAELHKHGIKTGLAILRETPVEWAFQIMHSFDHVLVFSGNLGHHGGEADLGLIDKVKKIQDHHFGVEIGWDGGVNDFNAPLLDEAGVDVLNAGGFIQGAEVPEAAYQTLVTSLKAKY